MNEKSLQYIFGDSKLNNKYFAGKKIGKMKTDEIRIKLALKNKKVGREQEKIFNALEELAALNLIAEVLYEKALDISNNIHNNKIILISLMKYVFDYYKKSQDDIYLILEKDISDEEIREDIRKISFKCNDQRYMLISNLSSIVPFYIEQEKVINEIQEKINISKESFVKLESFEISGNHIIHNNYIFEKIILEIIFIIKNIYNSY